MFGINQKMTERLVALIAASLSYALIIGLGTGLSLIPLIVDTVISILLAAGLWAMVWNVLRFSLEQASLQGQRVYFLLMLGVTSVTLMLSIECIIIYTAFAAELDIFASSIPVRALVLALLYIILAQKLEAELKEKAAERKDDSEITIAPALPAAKEPISKVSVRDGQKLVIIQAQDICYIKGEGDYVSINTADGHYLKEQTMKYFDENLPRDIFVRVHRSYIVNVSAISRIERYGEYQQLELKNGITIRISPSGYKLLRERLDL